MGEPEFWTCDDGEELSCRDFDEAVCEYLEDLEPEEWPETLEVRGFDPMVVAMPDVLAKLIDTLDEEYGDPYGGSTEATEAMREAEHEFLEVVGREYKPWACDQVCVRTINVLEWVKANEPQWLENDTRVVCSEVKP
jgi:hypothetical protein